MTLVPPMLPAPAQWYANLRLRILPLHVAVRWRRPASIPQHIISNVLRGAFNITFRRLVCPPEWFDNACPPCPLYEQCPYGQLFEPTPPTDSDRLRLQSDLPRPFVLKPPLPNASVRTDLDSSPPFPRFGGERSGERGPADVRAPMQPMTLGDRLRVRTAARSTLADSGRDPWRIDPERLEFGLVLFGSAIDHLPHFIVTLAELGRVGMGRDRIPFDIESVTTNSPSPPPRGRGGIGEGDSSPLDRPADTSSPTAEPLYNPATHTFTPPRRILNTSDFLLEPMRHHVEPPSVARPSSRGPRPCVTLRFLTPTLIRTGSGVDAQGRRIPAREVRERPEFGVLARRLRDRLSSLCAFFGEAPWTGPDFAELVQLADTVRLVRAETQWQHQSRRSTRTGETHEISGLTGEATYEFPTPELQALFAPLLQCAPQTHLGRHCVWGNGWVEVVDT